MADQQLDRATLIDAVKTPLGFFALAVLVVEGLLGGLALASEGVDRSFLVRVIPGLLLGLIVLVAAIAIWKPEALWGRRYHAMTDELANYLGIRVFEALDGSLSNLDAVAREEAYQVLRASILEGSDEKAEGHQFAQRFVGAILVHARIRDQWTKARGTLARKS